MRSSLRVCIPVALLHSRSDPLAAQVSPKAGREHEESTEKYRKPKPEIGRHSPRGQRPDRGRATEDQPVEAHHAATHGAVGCELDRALDSDTGARRRKPDNGDGRYREQRFLDAYIEMTSDLTLLLATLA